MNKVKKTGPSLKLVAFILAVLTAFCLVSCQPSDKEKEASTTQLPPDQSTPDSQGEEPEASDTIDDLFAPLDLIDKLFKENTIFEVDDEALVEAVLKAYVNATGDRYAEYFTDEEFAKLVDENKGNFVGVGIRVVQNAKSEFIEIVNVIPDSPAMHAGVLPGDKIIYIGTGEDRISVSEVGYTMALDVLAGVEGSIAVFTVDRNGEEIEFSIERKLVVSVSVAHRAYVSESGKKVGIVDISEFDLTTPIAFENAVDELISEGCEYFIFDVRNNPGGDLASITAVLSFFLNDGDTVIRVADRNGVVSNRSVSPKVYVGDYAGCCITESMIGKYKDLRCAVLTNENTASAAELFSAVLKDYGVSFTVGTTTFGKGTMQTTFMLASRGYKGALKLTAHYYYPPFSDSYEGIGIAPDCHVELDESLKDKSPYLISDEEDNQLNAAIAELESREK